MNKLLKSKISNEEKLKCPNCCNDNIIHLKILMVDGNKIFKCVNCNITFSDKNKNKNKQIDIVYK